MYLFLRYTTIFMLTFIFPFSIFSQNKNDLFPNSIGNYWQYEYGLPDFGMADYKSITDTTSLNGKTYFILETKKGTTVSEQFLRKDNDGNIWQYHEKENKELLWFNFLIPDSSFYYYRPSADADSFKVQVSHNINIETFAGRFENCVEFFFDIPGSFDEEQWFVFAPDVGIVKEQHASVTKFLSSAKINGKITSQIKQNTVYTPDFILEQNFPNPFNPTTQIPFSLEKSSSITLKIFDILGKEVATLAEGRYNSGPHMIRWEPADLANGVYIYQLKSKCFIESKKMTFIE